jgi:hypothetical protein
MPPGTLYRVAVVVADVSVKVSSPSSGLAMLIGFLICVTVGSQFSCCIERHYLWSKNTVLWDVLTAVSAIDGFW